MPAAAAPVDPVGMRNATAIVEFLGTLLKIAAIERVTYALHGGTLHVWVLFAHDDEDAMRDAMMAEHELRMASDSALIDVHFYALDEINADLLPPATVFFHR